MAPQPPQSNVPSSSGGSHEEKKLREGKTLKGMMREDIEKTESWDTNRTMLGDPPVSLKAEMSKMPDDQIHDNGPSGKEREDANTGGGSRSCKGYVEVGCLYSSGCWDIIPEVCRNDYY
jgi:hypothetical protein